MSDLLSVWMLISVEMALGQRDRTQKCIECRPRIHRRKIRDEPVTPHPLPTSYVTGHIRSPREWRNPLFIQWDLTWESHWLTSLHGWMISYRWLESTGCSGGRLSRLARLLPKLFSAFCCSDGGDSSRCSLQAWLRVGSSDLPPSFASRSFVL
jgi:hypothetical protein